MIANSNYLMRRYKEGDEKKINDLFNEIFNEKHSMNEWLWKFKENPLSNISLIALAESAGRIVGQFAALPCMFKFKDSVLKFGMGVDNFIHPEFRGASNGIQRAMSEYLSKIFYKEKMSLGFGCPNKAGYLFGKKFLKHNMTIGLTQKITTGRSILGIISTIY